MDNFLLQELLLASEPEEKAAIVAEAIFAMLPRETSLVARRCSILHWFSETTIEALLKDRLDTEGQFRGIYDQIKALPFLEVLPWGMTYNSLTREGLLRRYANTQPDMLRTAAQLAASSYRELGEDEKVAAEAFFCYIIAGETTFALELLNELMRKAYSNGNWEYINGLIQLAQEANQFSFVNPLPLSKILEPHTFELKFASFSNSPTNTRSEPASLAQSVMNDDLRLDSRLHRRTPEGRYEISEIDLVLNIRAQEAGGNTEGVHMLCAILLERCAPEFLRLTHGLRQRPELHEEVIANMNERLLREALDPNEIFITQNFIHYLRRLCADEFTRVLRQEGLHYRRDADGRPPGRPQHVPHSLIEPLRPARTDDEDESFRILTYLSDPLDRMIMVLRAIEGLPWDEIALACKRTERTVRLRYERARSYLRTCISEEYTSETSLVQQQPENVIALTENDARKLERQRQKE